MHTSGTGKNDAAVGRGYFATEKCETSGSKSSRGRQSTYTFEKGTLLL